MKLIFLVLLGLFISSGAEAFDLMPTCTPAIKHLERNTPRSKVLLPSGIATTVTGIFKFAEETSGGQTPGMSFAPLAVGLTTMYLGVHCQVMTKEEIAFQKSQNRKDLFRLTPEDELAYRRRMNFLTFAVGGANFITNLAVLIAARKAPARIVSILGLLTPVVTSYINWRYFAIPNDEGALLHSVDGIYFTRSDQAIPGIYTNWTF